MTELSTQTFELNLTSVCVSSGVIQLPLKMLQFFAQGPVPAEIDGASLALEFHAPRRLTGLRSHFAERGLRCNDKVRFELDLDGDRLIGLTATCVRRERPAKPEAQASAGQGRPDGVEDSRSRQGGNWDSVREVRAVKRVRIPGLPTAPAPAELDLATPVDGHSPARADWDRFAGDGADARSRNGAPHHPAEDDGMTTVRVRRRAPVVEDEAREKATGTSDRPAEQEPDGMAAPEVVQPIVERGQLQLSDLLAPPMTDGAGEPEAAKRHQRNWATLPARIRLGGRSAPPPVQRQPHTSGPTRRAVEDDVPTATAHGPAVEAPRELVTVGAPDSAAPLARQTASVVTSVANPVPPGRPMPVAGGQGNGTTSVMPLVHGEAPSTDPKPMSPEAEASQAARSQSWLPSARKSAEESGGAAESGQSDEASRGPMQLIDDADFGGDYLPTSGSAPTNQVEGASSLEADIACVDRYLSEPGTPAIVRSDAVGELLGIGHERAERALERISERPDRVNRIRRGAYMVRRRNG